ncbi:MAG TPA: ABC-F family ATP-binding cassette domain-containing protein [Thermoguttaceae bacterium]|nr:ABC-F family ATP-binding cassette domain-containing protein [Thermoguttaceae bacterium]
MILLCVNQIRKHFGPEPVLDGVTFDVRPEERIGLVGPNGCGKTTLLQIIAGREDSEGGQIALHPSARMGYLEQQPVFEPGRTVWDEARDALDELVALERESVDVARAMSETAASEQHDRLASRYDRLQQELHHRDGYNLDYKIKRVLHGLGFAQAALEQPVASLSGGEQNRLMLAKLLLAGPDVMLLDEPSNHLDLEATAWLEEYLVNCGAAVLMVSHDRYSLDRITNRTLELFRGTVESYRGNFSAYKRQKADRLLVERRTYEKQQEEIAKAKEFIRRNTYGQKHAQAEDRRKKLERIVPVPPPREITSPPMAFAEASRSGDIVLRAERIGKRFDRTLFENVNIDVTRGERWALVGPNGCGKTTMLRCLLGELQPDAGQVSLGQGVQPGYFDQQLLSVDENQSVVDAIRPEGRLMEEPKRRDLLARFGICGDTALQPVARLSGGERCRAALARLAAVEANLLVLDEPTNHLDLWAREALEAAIQRFEGTVLLVSHDRYLVNQVADHLLVAEPGRFRAIEGNYDTYQLLVAARAAEDAESPTKTPSSAKPAAESRVKSPELTAKTRKRQFPYRKTEEIEQEILQRETEIEEYHRLLTLPETHRDGARVRDIMADIEQRKEALANLYAHWEEATELNW